jgi:hypothetical protein
MLEKVEAVNIILRAAKEHPVSSLGSSTENDTLVAEQILDEVLMREQAKGLHVNTVESSFTPDSLNNYYVILPNNTLQVRGWNEHTYRNYFHRKVNGVVYLFDADEEPATRVFDDDSTVYVRITQSLDFESLPLLHQLSIAYQAAMEYQQAVLGSTQADRELMMRAQRARAEARAADMRSRPNNQFDSGLANGPRSGARYVRRPWPGSGNWRNY